MDNMLQYSWLYQSKCDKVIEYVEECFNVRVYTETKEHTIFKVMLPHDIGVVVFEIDTDIFMTQDIERIINIIIDKLIYSWADIIVRGDEDE